MNQLKTPTIGDCPYRPSFKYKEVREKLKGVSMRLEEKAQSRVKVWRNEK